MPDAASTEIRSYQCRHLFADGHRCGSRSLRNEHFCFYHHATRRPIARAKPENPADAVIDLPFPEDRASIQLSIGEILRRIAANQIDPRRAGLLLYGLQIASCNLPKAPTPGTDRASRSRRTRTAYAHRTEDDRQGDDQSPACPEEITLDPNLGPLAPVSEYIPYTPPPTILSQLLTI